MSESENKENRNREKSAGTLAMFLICLVYVFVPLVSMFAVSFFYRYADPRNFFTTAGLGMVLASVVYFIFRGRGHVRNLNASLAMYLATSLICIFQATAFGSPIFFALFVACLIATPIYLLKAEKGEILPNRIIKESLCLIGLGVVLFSLFTAYGAIMLF